MCVVRGCWGSFFGVGDCFWKGFGVTKGVVLGGRLRVLESFDFYLGFFVVEGV